MIFRECASYFLLDATARLNTIPKPYAAHNSDSQIPKSLMRCESVLPMRRQLLTK